MKYCLCCFALLHRWMRRKENKRKDFWLNELKRFISLINRKHKLSRVHRLFFSACLTCFNEALRSTLFLIYLLNVFLKQAFYNLIVIAIGQKCNCPSRRVYRTCLNSPWEEKSVFSPPMTLQLSLNRFLKRVWIIHSVKRSAECGY